MTAMPSIDELIELVHRYYPASIETYDERYESSPESRRLQALLEPLRRELEEERKDTQWQRFVKRLGEEFAGCFLWDTTPPLHDPCYSVRVYLPGFVMGDKTAESVVALIGVLAPVYVIYASRDDEQDGWVEFPPLPADYQEHAAQLAALIESEYGFVRLPNDALFARVPDLAPWGSHLALGEASLIDCLFTHRRW